MFLQADEEGDAWMHATDEAKAQLRPLDK